MIVKNLRINAVLNLLPAFHAFLLFPIQRTKTPELVPDDSEPILLRGAQKIISANTMKQRSHGIIREISDRLSDPRTGPFLLLGALMSFGTIWLRRSQQTQSSQSKKPNQPKKVSDGLTYLSLMVFELCQWCLQLLLSLCEARDNILKEVRR